MGSEMAIQVIQSNVLDDQVLFSVVPWLVVDYWQWLEDLLGILKKRKKSDLSNCSNPSLSVRFLHELVPCVFHNLVNWYAICFCKSDIIYCLEIISATMMQIQHPKTLASKGSISVFTKLKKVEFSYRLFQPLKKEANIACANTSATSKLNKLRLWKKEGQEYQLPPFSLAETWRCKGIAKCTLFIHPEKDTIWMHSLNRRHNDYSNVTQQNGYCQIALAFLHDHQDQQSVNQPIL